MDCSELSQLLQGWSRAAPRRLEVAAALKDFIALRQLAPIRPMDTIARTNSGVVSRLLPLARAVQDMCCFLRQQAIPLISRKSQGHTTVTSPFSGGTVVRHALKESSSQHPQSHSVDSIVIATLNPGRTGLSSLSTGDILWWRLWHIATALQEREAMICIVPSARWPPGASLPPGFPFAWVGRQTLQWDSVGMLVATELELSLVPLQGLGSDRVMWHLITGVHAPAMILGSIYPAPGGDVATWRKIRDDICTIRNRHPGVRVVVGGDGNVHFKSIFSDAHDLLCACPHCVQSTADRDIEADMKAIGMVPFNPPIATHDDGYCLDVFMGEPRLPFDVQVVPEKVGESDHDLVLATVPVSVGIDYRSTLGRVRWAGQDEWESGLRAIPDTLQSATQATMSAEQEILQARDIPIKRRRAILDAAAWLRDAVYTVVGHMSQAVKATSARDPTPYQGTLRGSRPESYQEYEQFKMAIEQTCWQARVDSAQRFQQLRVSDPPAAARLIARVFNTAPCTRVALSRDTNGSPMSYPEMVSMLQQDMMNRADNDFYQSQEDKERLAQAVADIRRARAPASGIPNLSPPNALPNQGPYTMKELLEVVSKLKTHSQCIRGCYAAVRATAPHATQLTLSLMNLGRAARATSTLWSLREFNHLRKKGPYIVRQVNNLRPVSQCTDLAAVQDGLWLGRCLQQLEAYTGQMQIGGKAGPIILVLALLLAAQIRYHQGMHTTLVFGDMQFAFDTADINSMLVAVYQAGIVGDEWEIYDDIMRMDHQRIHLAGRLSPIFKLISGTAQGRKISSPVFTTLMTWLQEEILQVAPTARLILPPFAKAVLDEANTRSPTTQEALPVSDWTVISDAVRDISSTAAREDPPWTASQESVTQHMSSLPHLSDRIQILEQLGRAPMGPLLYIDDVTAICPSAGAATAVTTKAFPRYEAKVKAKFNRGPAKTATMPLLGAPAVCSHDVDVYRLLGILLDAQLTLQPRLNEILRSGRELFLETLYAAMVGGFAIPVASAQVMIKVEPHVLYGAELLVLLPHAAQALNRLQSDWALRLLGAPSSQEMRGHLATVQCGWVMRLGTRMYEAAIMARATIFLLPAEHPTAVSMRIADGNPMITWSSMSRDLMCGKILPSKIHDIADTPVCTPALLWKARTDSATRKAVLRRYRWEVVRPILYQYDQAAYAQAATKTIVALGWTFARLQPRPSKLPVDLLRLDTHPSAWRWFKMWAQVRLTGAWPIPTLGGESFPIYIAECPACGSRCITVRHPLCECPGTLVLYRQLCSAVSMPHRQQTSLFMYALFAHDPPVSERAQHVRYVGLALHPGVVCHLSAVNQVHDTEEDTMLIQQLDALVEEARSLAQASGS